MKVEKAATQNFSYAAQIIRQGGLVAFPTETVYGLGADACNARACARIFEVKNRPSFDPLIVHIAEIATLNELCAGVNERAWLLAEKFWPGPLTLVLPKSEIVPDIVSAGLSTVAIRLPNHSVALALIRAAQTPLAAPSANPFGYLSPTTAGHVQEQIGSRIDLILDGGPCSVGIESTIIDLSSDKPRLLRPGGLPLEEIEAVCGKIEIDKTSAARPLAPGQLPSHYAPRTPIVIMDKNQQKFSEGGKIGLLSFQAPREISPYFEIEILSEKGDLREAAANLFSCLHRLDQAGLDLIHAEPVPEEGLGRAIMDRLRRAAAGKHVS